MDLSVHTNSFKLLNPPDIERSRAGANFGPKIQRGRGRSLAKTLKLNVIEFLVSLSSLFMSDTQSDIFYFSLPSNQKTRFLANDQHQL